MSQCCPGGLWVLSLPTSPDTVWRMEQSSFLAGLHNKFSVPFDSLPRDCPFTSVIIKQLWQSSLPPHFICRPPTDPWAIVKLTGQGADILGTYSHLSCHVHIYRRQGLLFPFSFFGASILWSSLRRRSICQSIFKLTKQWRFTNK